MTDILNVSAYLFTELADPAALRAPLRERALSRELRGTILLAEEGINLVLAGSPVDVRAFIEELKGEPRFAALQTKESWSTSQPFGRMLVKVKREIIRMDHPTIRPGAGRAAAVDAPTLKRWLDQGHDDDGKPVVMLDTRNAFEVEYGAFDAAIDWRLDRFTEFPDAAAARRDELEGKRVVTYCTGGIRCEKAALFAHELGLDDVVQLDGGILTYFEQVGDAHWNGECFVFDEREALAPDLTARR